MMLGLPLNSFRNAKCRDIPRNYLLCKKKPTRNFRFSGRPISQLVGLLRPNILGDRRTNAYIG